MLSLMRKQAKSWLIKFLIGILSLVFIFYFGYSFTSRNSGKMATVNGELITKLAYDKEYRDMVDGLRRQYGDAWNQNLIKALDLKNRALQNLINRELISQEAKKLGFQVTKRETQRAIMAYPAFQVNGQFDVGRYQAVLNQNSMQPEDFEKGIAQELLQAKLKQFLLTFLPVTTHELRDDYTLTHEQVDLEYLQIKPDRFTSSVKVDPSAMEAFFKAHRENYRVPEKIKLVYLPVDPADFKGEVKVSEKDIKDYYEFNLDKFKVPEKICARHILFKLAENASKADVAKVRKRAESVLKLARAGKDFAALARKYSEGPSRAKGGELGCFSRGTMVKPFEDAAFKLKKGEISDLVRTRFGFHIIKVEDVKKGRTKSLDEVRSQVIDELKKSDTRDLARNKGLSLMDAMPYNVDLAKYAAENKMKVQYTSYFSMKDPIPGLGGDGKLRQSLFSLGKNETSDLIPLDGKFIIFQVAGREPSHLPRMKAVQDEVRRDLINHLAEEKAKSTAETYLAALRKGAKWEKVVEESGVKPGTTGFFTRQGPIPKIGYDQSLIEVAFHLSEANRYPDKTFETPDGAFVVRWTGLKGIDPKDFQKVKKQFRFSLIRLKQNTAFQNWLEALRREAKIQVVAPVQQ